MPIIKVPHVGSTRSAKVWHKHLTSVDTSISTGYAFQGEFLRNGQLAELSEGSWILTHHTDQSARGTVRGVEVTLSRVITPNTEGDEQPDPADYVCEIEAWTLPRDQVWSWALAVRDDIARIMAEADDPTETSTDARGDDTAAPAAPDHSAYEAAARLRAYLDANPGTLPTGEWIDDLNTVIDHALACGGSTE